MLEEFERILDQAEDNLLNNVLPFWAHHAWDEEQGGFLTRLDRAGRRLESEEKFLMMQVRLIASFSWGWQCCPENARYRDLAERGFDYLIAHFRDAEAGGFFFSVDRAGRPKCRRKNTDVHAYVLTGLSVYHEVSRDPRALDWAEKVFQVLEQQARDGELGYVEDFDGQPWPALNAEQMNLGDGSRIKTIDMHTNMLEGLTYLAAQSGKAEHLQALRQVFSLIRDRGLDAPSGCTITAVDRNWIPVPDGNGQMTTSYGINVELAWLLLEAARHLSGAEQVARDAALRLLDHALDFGFDWERGGLAAYGPMTGHVLEATQLPENRLLKAWWEQAELLNALVAAYDLTGASRYAEALVRLWDWILKHQIDHEYGDWYQDCHWETGEPVSTDKGGEFKTAFHVSRALTRLIRGLHKEQR